MTSFLVHNVTAGGKACALRHDLASHFHSGSSSPLLRLVLFTLCIYVISLPGFAADYPKKISFRNIVQDQGGALGEVEAITQDYQGFMWLGGRNALLRYDGYEFLKIPVFDDPQDLTKPSAINQVMDLFEDSHHRLWVATRSGLYQYDRDREILLPVQDKQGRLVARDLTYALAEAPTGELLAGSIVGLYVIDSDKSNVTLLNHQSNNQASLPSNPVNDIYRGKDGNIWLGLTEGLVRLDWATKKYTLFTPDPADPKSTASNSVRTIAEDHEGNIWAGTDQGIYRLNPASGTAMRYRNDPKDPHSIANDLTRRIYVDQQGWVWTGSDSGGVSLYNEDKDNFSRFSYEDDIPGSLSSNTIRRIYEDNIGNIWVGTYPSGVNVYDRATDVIHSYRRVLDPAHGLLDNNVEAVEEDKEGNLWIGAGGVSRYDPKTETFTHYMHTEGADTKVSTGALLNGLIDSDGEIRFGSWAHGILKFNPKTDRFDEIPTDTTQVERGQRTGRLLNDQMVWSVYEDKQKTLWIATHFNGLTKFDKKTGVYSFYPHNPEDPTSISCPVVWITFEDSKGRFWVGTAYGLNLMDREKGIFKRYVPMTDTAKGLVNGSILSIAEDHKGRLWFGTDMGLHLYQPDTNSFTVFDTKDGFADHSIRTIIEDEFGNLWLGTNNGVVMFNPDSKVVRNYVRYNGMVIGGVATGAAVATKSGEMVFGTRNGLYIFDPQKLTSNKKIPPVVLTDFRLFTQKVSVGAPDKILTKVITQTEKLTLDYTQSMISFSFAALNFREPEKNQYAYKLEGFDDQWRQVDNQRTALYTNLPAGTYLFHVKASNNDGLWNEKGASVTLVILPPPWKTWWAYCLYIAAFIGLLLWFVYSQHKKVLNERKTSRELENKVADRTVELKNKNQELELAYKQLEAISLSDPLTGLNNRRYLQKLMPMDIAKVQREYERKFLNNPPKKPSLDLTFFILDVDYFKSVNDLYGHAAGDHLLVQLSNVLTTICRESDCVVRWGGEEFLIVSRFSEREDAALMAERIRSNIERHDFTLPDGRVLKKTCSIGFACFPFFPDEPVALSWEQVVDIADHALYAAKKSGRNRSIGLVSNSTTEKEHLYQRISCDIKAVISNNQLTVIAKDTIDLTWD